MRLSEMYLLWRLEDTFIELMEAMGFHIQINKVLKNKVILIDSSKVLKSSCSDGVKDAGKEIIDFITLVGVENISIKVENQDLLTIGDTGLTSEDEISFFHQLFKFIVLRQDHWKAWSVGDYISRFSVQAAKITISQSENK